MHGVAAAWQYVILGVGALGATIGMLWLYNRRERRRKHAIELMKLMNRWGLEWFSDLYEDYAVGDYSGMAVKVKEIVQAVRSDEAMVAKLGEVAKRVAAHYAANDRGRAQELLVILQPAKAAVAVAA